MVISAASTETAESLPQRREGLKVRYRPGPAAASTMTDGPRPLIDEVGRAHATTLTKPVDPHADID